MGEAHLIGSSSCILQRTLLASTMENVLRPSHQGGDIHIKARSRSAVALQQCKISAWMRRLDGQGFPLVRVAPGVMNGELSEWTDTNAVRASWRKRQSPVTLTSFFC